MPKINRYLLRNYVKLILKTCTISSLLGISSIYAVFNVLIMKTNVAAIFQIILGYIERQAILKIKSIILTPNILQ